MIFSECIKIDTFLFHFLFFNFCFLQKELFLLYLFIKFLCLFQVIRVPSVGQQSDHFRLESLNLHKNLSNFPVGVLEVLKLVNICFIFLFYLSFELTVYLPEPFSLFLLYVLKTRHVGYLRYFFQQLFGTIEGLCIFN